MNLSLNVYLWYCFLQWDDPERSCGQKKQERPGTAYRKVFNTKTWTEDFVETDEPELYIKGNGDEQQPEQIRPKKKVALTKRDHEAQAVLDKADSKKEHTETAPREVITTSEGALIQNFEVDFGT